MNEQNFTPRINEAPPPTSGVGYVIVNVTTARGAIPLEGDRSPSRRHVDDDVSYARGGRRSFVYPRCEILFIHKLRLSILVFLISGICQKSLNVSRFYATRGREVRQSRKIL